MNPAFALALGLLMLTAVDANQPNSLLDIVPVVAHAKSIVQQFCGDEEGAKKTRETYYEHGLGPSQVRSIYHLVKGEPDKALALQKQFLVNAESVVDSLPLVGHAKGLVHILAGDTKHGWDAIKSATSTTGTVIGAVLGGPAGAVAGHAVTDVSISGVDRIVGGDSSQTYGLVDYAANIGKWSVGEHVDAIGGLLLDAAGGRSAKKSSAKSKKTSAVAPSKKQIGDTNAVERPPTAAVKQAARVAGRGGEKTVADRAAVAGEEATADERSPVRQTVPEGSSEARVGNFDRPTVEEQAHIRREAEFVFQETANEMANGEMFTKFNRFLRENPAYERKQLYRWETDPKPVVFNENNKRLNMKKMADASVAKLTYLSKTQQELVGLDEFRNVNSLPDETKNCFSCSVAGALKKDVKTLHTEVNEFSKEAYSKDAGSNPEKFLAECEKASLIEYDSSPDLMSLEELHSYLKENEKVHDSPDTKSIVTMFDNDGQYQGHSYVAEYKFLGDSSVPEMVLVDYQQAPYFFPYEPNPMRFINYVDTASYTNFKVHTIRTLPVERIKTVGLKTEEMALTREESLSKRRQARVEKMKDPEYRASEIERQRKNYVKEKLRSKDLDTEEMILKKEKALKKRRLLRQEKLKDPEYREMENKKQREYYRKQTNTDTEENILRRAEFLSKKRKLRMERMQKDPEYKDRESKRRRENYEKQKQLILEQAEAAALTELHESGPSVPQEPLDLSKSSRTAPQAAPGPS